MFLRHDEPSGHYQQVARRPAIQANARQPVRQREFPTMLCGRRIRRQDAAKTTRAQEITMVRVVERNRFRVNRDFALSIRAVA
jgi:hypothetical protein